MQRRDFLRFVGLGCLSSMMPRIRPGHAHQDDADRAPTAGRQLVRRPAPTFTLTAQDEQPFAFRSWRERAVAITFGYTSCPDVCPLLVANFTLIQQQLPETVQAHTGFLFITTDPEHDTPAVLWEYGARLGADFATWKFLTGDLAAIKSVCRGFGVSVKKFGPAQVDHTTLTTLVDQGGLRRINYYGTRWEPRTLQRDLMALVQREGSQF
jgi:protein SCO1/2